MSLYLITDTITPMTNIEQVTQLVAEKYLPANPLEQSVTSSEATFSVVAPDGTFTQTITGGDIYDIIYSDEARQMASKAEFIAIVTHGWASPITGDDEYSEVPPSQHPERRRVSICAVASRDASVHSAMRMAGEDDFIFDSSGRGALADAIYGLFA